MVTQAYAVRYQTLMTSEAFRSCADTEERKILIGTFIFDYVKMFLDQLMLQRGIMTQEPQLQRSGIAPKVTGMIMSLPPQHLILGISTY